MKRALLFGVLMFLGGILPVAIVTSLGCSGHLLYSSEPTDKGKPYIDPRTSEPVVPDPVITAAKLLANRGATPPNATDIRDIGQGWMEYTYRDCQYITRVTHTWPPLVIPVFREKPKPPEPLKEKPKPCGWTMDEFIAKTRAADGPTLDALIQRYVGSQVIWRGTVRRVIPESPPFPPHFQIESAGGFEETLFFTPAEFKLLLYFPKDKEINFTATITQVRVLGPILSDGQILDW